MIIISHRGLLDGPNSRKENRPDMVNEALSEGFDVELDVWVKKDKRFWLGHDRPQFQLKKGEEWFLKNYNFFWLHAKNLEALIKLTHQPRTLKAFWHQIDNYIFIPDEEGLVGGYIWTFPGLPVPEKCGIMVMPEWDSVGNILDSKAFEKKILQAASDDVAGICTDYPRKVKEILTPKQLTYQREVTRSDVIRNIEENC